MLGSPIAPDPVRGTASTVGQQQDRLLNNVPPGRPSVEFLTLPNPYERDVPPMPPPHDNIASPTSPLSHRASAYTNPSPSSHSHTYTVVPSAWPFEDSSEALLSRGPTRASHLTTSSGLHEDLVGYQKALEAHHRKEEEDVAQGEGGSSQARAVPEDPPPIYPGRE
ncbi:hypothetical protein BN946_scf184796.g21 [Trametes cinnabarina]|uniref:Uncharacterized protein n=1 Tax=Pycnoporus cinnabarinus TaxID=5643 RepID=A0A060SQA5_PYCCI|nr:hypothetical protein BN946_scf184796.g21 [Trametes cinnabarina]